LTLLLQKLTVGVSPTLTDWYDLLQTSSILKSPAPVDPSKPATDDKTNTQFYRLIDNTAKGRPLQYICFVDNEGTGTQAAVWADMKEKMVSVISPVM
jgi:hypothetical protein